MWELDIKDIKTDIDIKKTFVHENKHKVDGEEQAVKRIKLKKKKKLKEHCCFHILAVLKGKGYERKPEGE